MPRRFFWCLQECCKCPEEFFGVCRNAANAKMEETALAELLQAFPETFWPSRGFRRDSLLAVCLEKESQSAPIRGMRMGERWRRCVLLLNHTFVRLL